MGMVASLVWVEIHGLQFTSDLRNRNLFLIMNRNLNLQELNTGQTEINSLTTNRTLTCIGQT